MLKIKTFFLYLAGILLLSAAAQARVCFLGGGSAEGNGALCLVAPKFESEICPGYTICEVPQSGARACVDGDDKFYLPEDCCTDSAYVRCDSASGKVCSGSVCTGVDGEGTIYEACESGRCSCDSSYSETCSAADGLIGVGVSCDGKYQSCQCDNNYYTCDANASCEGSSCNDTRGELCTSCVCPAADGSDWVSDPDVCCWGYSTTCTNRPGGTTVYKCKTSQPKDCTCGYSYNTGKTSCITGCTDSTYDYQGNIPAHAVCNDYTGGIKGACGSDCSCESGYWDYPSTCSSQTDSICSQLGYTDTACDGKWIGCPYDKTAKKCLDGEASSLICPSGSYATKAQCSGTGLLTILCTQNDDGCWEPAKIASTCLLGTYATKEECVAANQSGTTITMGSCKELSNGCWEFSQDDSLIAYYNCCTYLDTTSNVYDCRKTVNGTTSQKCSYTNLESTDSSYTCTSQTCTSISEISCCDQGFAYDCSNVGGTCTNTPPSDITLQNACMKCVTFEVTN